MEIGVYTFGDVAEGISPAQRLRDLVEEGVAADRAGLDVFGVGEHHRPDYAVSAPAVALAAVAARTERIRLTSAVSVISSDDPVRVFQQFATLDGISGGRAEIMAGRGSFIESFPLFGYELDHYEELFAEALDLLLAIRSDPSHVAWQGSGRHRAAVPGLGVHPAPVQDPLPLWIAVGGTPQSIVRAGVLGLPMALAIIGGDPARFAPLVELHRRAAAERGHDPLPVSINAHCFVLDDSDEAADTFWAAYAPVMARIGRERGWPPMTRDQFELARGERGNLVVGSPDEVVAKLRHWQQLFGHGRFLAQFSMGSLPHEAALRCTELLGTEVAPALRG